MAIGAGIGILSKALPVITGLGKAGAWTALGGGVATGLTAGGMKIGQLVQGEEKTLENIARKEDVDLGDASLVDPVTGKVTQVKDYGLVDQFRGAVLGFDEKDVAAIKTDQKRKGIDRTFQSDRKDLEQLRSDLGLTPKDLTIKPGQTEEEVERNITKETSLLTAAQAIKDHASGKGDLSKLGTNPNLSQLTTELNKLNNEDPLGERGTNQYNRTQSEEAVTRDMIRHRDNQELLLAQLIQQGNTNNNQFALQMAQQDYNNRALEMREARDSRKDKQLMIMQLMKGLSDMGKAFAY